MSSGTMYLEIPKERVATILTQNLSSYEVKDDSDDQIVIKEYVNPFIGMPKYKKRAVIENHNTGKDSKVEYYKDEVYDELEDYTL